MPWRGRWAWPGSEREPASLRRQMAILLLILLTPVGIAALSQAMASLHQAGARHAAEAQQWLAATAAKERAEFPTQPANADAAGGQPAPATRWDGAHLDQRVAALSTEARAVAFIGADGGALSTPDAGTAWLPPPETLLQDLGETPALLTGQDGVARLYALAPVQDPGLWLLTAVPRFSMVGALVGADGPFIVAPLLLWLITLVAILLVVDLVLARHATALGRAVSDGGAGSAGADGDSWKEVRAVGSAFDSMNQRLAVQDRRLDVIMTAQSGLLEELHHRVRNNLQTISSLINLQKRQAKTEREERLLNAVQDRVHALSLMYQHLGLAGHGHEVALDELVRAITVQMRSAVLHDRRGVPSLTFALSEVSVGAGVATPISLFVVEAMSVLLDIPVGKAVDPRGTGDTAIHVSLIKIGDRFRVEFTRNAVDNPGAIGTVERRLMDGLARQLNGAYQAVIGADHLTLCLEGEMDSRLDAVTRRRPVPAEDRPISAE